MEGASGLTPPRLPPSRLEPGGCWDSEMRDVNEAGAKQGLGAPGEQVLSEEVAS